MRNKSILWLSLVITIIATTGIIVSCNKKFDEPPAASIPDSKVNTTIKALKGLHTLGGYEQVTHDLIISGIIVGNDKNGNLYKQVCIQDATGGITVLLDGNSLYAQYPVGRQLFIKCKGLWLSDYGKLIQLGVIDKSVPGNPSLTGIPSTLFDIYIEKGTFNNPVTPKIVTIRELNDTLQSTLIQVNNVEYQASDTGRTYADTSANKSSVNLTLHECSGSKVVTYTSGYASFAGLKPPKGNGSVTAVYFIYKTTPELIIRDTSDVKLYGARCAGTATLLSISALRNMYTGSNVTLGNYFIKGIVISDASNKNIPAGNIVLQDGTSGIDLYYGTTANTGAFNIGDSIIANVTGGKLQSYNGLLEVSLAPGQLPGAALAAGRTVIPQVLTVQEVNAQIASVECTLVKIVGAKATPAGTYSGNKTLTDATGNLTLFTTGTATFTNQNLPTVSSDWVGFPNRYNTVNQFRIRNPDDVTTSGNGGGISTGTGIELTTAPLILNFDNIGSGLPQGVFVKLSSTASSIGADGVYTTAKGSWSASGNGFKNYASATGLTATSSQAAQDAATNRALGVRQTGASGYDPGTAFVFQLNNTTGKTNLILGFLLQSLDNSIGRTAKWMVDYATGDNPTSFTPIATTPATVTTGPSFSSTPVSVNFGNTLNNISSKVWIRITTLTATTGSGSRPSSAIDDVRFSWQ